MAKNIVDSGPVDFARTGWCLQKNIWHFVDIKYILKASTDILYVSVSEFKYIHQMACLALILQNPISAGAPLPQTPSWLGRGILKNLKNVTNFCSFWTLQGYKAYSFMGLRPMTYLPGALPLDPVGDSAFRLPLQAHAPCLSHSQMPISKNAPSVALKIHFGVRHIVSWKLCNWCNLRINYA